MQVRGSSVRQWFSKEMMRLGHQGNYPSHPKRRGKPPAVEVRKKLPLPRGRPPSTAHTPEDTSTACVPETKGEYYKQDTPNTIKMGVLWPNSLYSLTMYAFDPQAQELTAGPREATYHILSNTGQSPRTAALDMQKWR